jgi:hypothetical protein
MFNGKIHYKWQFSIAMLNYQRVTISIYFYDFYSLVNLFFNMLQTSLKMDHNGSINPRNDGLNWLNVQNWGLRVIYPRKQGSCPVERG